MEGNELNHDSPKVIRIVDRLTEVIRQELDRKFPDPQSSSANFKEPELFDDYIPKSAVRGKFLAASTLWKHERKGNLKTYAIGGKRFYKRSEIQNLIQEVKR